MVKKANEAINGANLANIATNENETVEPVKNGDEQDDNYLSSTPVIPQTVYDNLPSILKEGAEVFLEQREKDTFLTGALAVLSGCMSNVTGLYGGRITYPNLFSFILAPAASGKGAMQSSKELADVYHNEVIKHSEDQKKEYLKKMDEYRKSMDSEDEKTGIKAMPKEPPFKVVFIPANTSSAKIIQHLQNNDGAGIICESEADTMGQAFKNEWGQWSDILRKAFHQEKISISRKTNNEYLEIDTPRMSVALSGTPKQVFNIISSAEDGLFSRFIFYVFKTVSKWKDPSPFGGQTNLTAHFAKLGIQVNEMVRFLNTSVTTVEWTQEQWERFNVLFAKYLDQISLFVSDDAQSIVKRLGLIMFRFCMIFSALRKFEQRSGKTTIQCLDTDFEIALELIEVYLQHSIAMYGNLPKQKEETPFKSGENKKRFFDALPKLFSLKEAVALGKNFGIKERTVSTLLKDCLGKYLLQPKYGQYEKM